MNNTVEAKEVSKIVWCPLKRAARYTGWAKIMGYSTSVWAEFINHCF